MTQTTPLDQATIDLAHEALDKNDDFTDTYEGGYDVAEPTGNENVELLREVLQYASEEEAIAAVGLRDSAFDMSVWAWSLDASETAEPLTHATAACGTAACLAGTAAWMTLGKGEALSFKFNTIFEKEGGALLGVIADRGARRLGLNEAQADALFLAMDSDLDELRAIASFISGVDLTQADQAGIDAAVAAERARLAREDLSSI